MTVSKELFEAVMGFSVNSIEPTTVYANVELGIRYEREENTLKIVDCVNINDFFFKCIDFMKDNDIDYYLDINNDIRNEVFEFLDNWLLENK